MLQYFYIGETAISLYNVFLILGLVLAVVLAVFQRDVYGLRAWKAALAGTVYIAAGVLLCWVFAVVVDGLLEGGNGSTYSTSIDFFGAVLFFPLVIPLLSRLFSMSARSALNLCAKSLAVIRIFNRIGCFCAGCCGGRVVTLFGTSVHLPSRIFGSAGCLLILALLLHVESRDSQASLYPLFLVTYCPLRFVQEFMMTFDKFALGLTIDQYYSMIGFAMGLIAILYGRRRKRRTEKSPGAQPAGEKVPGSAGAV